jgi:uncharacterized protein
MSAPFTSIIKSRDKTTDRYYLIIEFICLFVLLPVVYWLDWFPFHKVIPLLLLFIYCLAILFQHGRFTKNLLSVRAPWAVLLIRFVLTTSIILGVLFVTQKGVFADLQENPKLMLMLIMYPFLSALPQEVIFREFFFYRYARLFPQETFLVLMNVLMFSFAHIYFGNWIVLIFTLAGGLLFALTYLKTRSLLVVSIEHSLYGLVILASPLHLYFYKAF